MRLDGAPCSTLAALEVLLRSVTLLMMLVACPKANPTPEAARLQSHVVAEGDASDMHVRLAHLTQARDFVIKGQLDEARAQLRWVSENVTAEGVRPEWVVHLQDIHAGTVEGMAARDASGVAEAISDVARACGECHLAVGDGPRFEPEPPPATSAAMARHVWAADRMWEGIVGPDPDRWTLAADLLRIEVVDFETLYGAVDLETAGDAARLHSRVHSLADLGRETVDAGDRAELYGAYVAACADCHALVGGGPR